MKRVNFSKLFKTVNYLLMIWIIFQITKCNYTFAQGKKIKGKIIVLAGDIAQVKIGRNDGVEENMEFQIKRKDKVIGTAKAIEISETSCRVKITSVVKDVEIDVGDTVESIIEEALGGEKQEETKEKVKTVKTLSEEIVEMPAFGGKLKQNEVKENLIEIKEEKKIVEGFEETKLTEIKKGKKQVEKEEKVADGYIIAVEVGKEKDIVFLDVGKEKAKRGMKFEIKIIEEVIHPVTKEKINIFKTISEGIIKKVYNVTSVGEVEKDKKIVVGMYVFLTDEIVEMEKKMDRAKSERERIAEIKHYQEKISQNEKKRLESGLIITIGKFFPKERSLGEEKFFYGIRGISPTNKESRYLSMSLAYRKWEESIVHSGYEISGIIRVIPIDLITVLTAFSGNDFQKKDKEAHMTGFGLSYYLVEGKVKLRDNYGREYIATDRENVPGCHFVLGGISKNFYVELKYEFPFEKVWNDGNNGFNVGGLSFSIGIKF